MINKNYTKEYILKFLNKNQFFYDKISSEYLENKKLNDNIVCEFTNFTGDTGRILVDSKNTFLLVDGRYTLQAKNECKNTKVIEISREFSETDFIKSKIKSSKTLILNSKKISIDEANRLKNIFGDKKLMVKHLDFNEEVNIEECFFLENRYTTYKARVKIFNLYNELKRIYKIDNFFYITSNLNEIATLTNIRRVTKCDNDIYIKGHLIIFDKFSILYSNIKNSRNISKYLKDNNIYLKREDDFYEDLKNIDLVFKKNIRDVIIDYRTNNYYTYECIKNNKKVVIHDENNSTFTKINTIKTKTEIKNLYKINIVDSKFLINVIYILKHFNFDKYKLSEYDVKCFLESIKRSDDYVTTSFDTIVAYGENASMPHYSPKKNSSKIIKNDNILLIDIGGHYLGGTTDVTRTISLYRDNKKIPLELKKNYTLVLKSLLNILFQKFKNGATYDKIDFLARSNLFNECLDYNHSTGHGIGTFSDVHFGNNIYSKNNKTKIIEINEVQSAEPAIYIENKYGIRLEVDTLTKSDTSNKFGQFLKFETLTLCPFDSDLIDKNMLNSDDKSRLNMYNERIYKMMSKYLSKEVKKWLKSVTKKI